MSIAEIMAASNHLFRQESILQRCAASHLPLGMLLLTIICIVHRQTNKSRRSGQITRSRAKTMRRETALITTTIAFDVHIAPVPSQKGPGDRHLEDTHNNRNSPCLLARYGVDFGSKPPANLLHCTETGGTGKETYHPAPPTLSRIDL